MLGIAGGDGSLGAVAQACVERDLAFVCVPFGTRNHFARDVGLDRRDPAAALAAFDPDAEERRVDVGRIDGRVFLNNVSLGVYAGLVHEREERRRRREALARLKALARLATSPRRAAILLDGAPVEARLVLVANNSYTRSGGLTLGARERLDAGRLHLYVVAGRVWEERELERLTLDAPGSSATAAVDGEPAQLEVPLELAIEPLALRLRLPRGTTSA